MPLSCRVDQQRYSQKISGAIAASLLIKQCHALCLEISDDRFTPSLDAVYILLLSCLCLLFIPEALIPLL